LVGTAFGTSLQATVRDTNGNLMNGVTVNFAAPSSGASAALSSNSAVTNSSGVASVTATANTLAGSYNVTASVGSLTAAFALTNSAGSPASVTAAAGTPQATLLSTAFAIPLQAIVKDADGNPLSAVTVTFASPGSGPSANLSAATVQTNVSGVASVIATANSSAGAYNVTASVGQLTAAFALTNAPYSPCDINQDTLTNVVDARAMVNEALGKRSAANDLNLDEVVNAVDLQIVINGALGLGCAAK
jgi:hypothetical protein